MGTIEREFLDRVDQNADEMARAAPTFWPGVWYVTRWIVFVPFAILAGALVNMLHGVLIYFFGDSPMWFAQLITAATLGFIVIGIGAWTAPCRNKTVPVIVLGSLLIMIGGASAFACLLEQAWWDMARVTVCVGFTIAAIVWGIRYDWN